MTIEDVAVALRDDNDTDVHLLYAFNSVGKTRLSVAYKDATKAEDGTHSGIYYNAYSEDLFVWNNDIDNGEADIRLTVLPSGLSKLHADLNELDIHEKLKPYRPNFDFPLRHACRCREGHRINLVPSLQTRSLAMSPR